MHDYRFDPFQDILQSVLIAGETHTIPSVSPYTIRLGEVPQKETPSSISLTISGVAGVEVAATPAVGEFWPDYSTGADNDETWNTGTILFNEADAGKTVVVAYKGMGTLVDTRALPRIRNVFTASGSWLCPAGVYEIDIYLCGGGGGGGYTTTNGGAGGTSSFGGTLLVATGGAAGNGSTTTARAPGGYSSSVNGIVLLPGGMMLGSPGIGPLSGPSRSASGYGNGGLSLGLPLQRPVPGQRVNEAGHRYWGYDTNNGHQYAMSAPGGGSVTALRIPVTPGRSYAIVIGAGGAAAAGQSTYVGNGSPGVCIIMY